MRPYQKEYISNLEEIAAFTARRKPEDKSLTDYLARFDREEKRHLELVGRNMELLRGELFPQLDHLPDADGAALAALNEFAACLLEGLDTALFGLIHQALLSLARQREDWDGIIRELYWLGIGQYARAGSLVGLDIDLIEPVFSQMRMCFAEAAAHIKYFEEIESEETRSYIFRSLINRSLGQFKHSHARVRLLKSALEVFQDPFYREKSPELPWDRYILQTHQLMASSISFNRDVSMSSQDVADIMESVYVVYNEQTQIAAAGEKMDLQPAFQYYAIEYFCGLDSLSSVLGKVENLIDGADQRDFSTKGMYGAISLPALYCQYLQQYPEMLWGREAYLEAMYQRVLDYVEAFPTEAENKPLFLYLGQMSFAYIETAGSIPYTVFLQKLLLRFAPEVYLHAETVAAAAAELSDIILAEEPGFFDDMDYIRAIEDPVEKRREVLCLARGCGAFHDVGQMNFIDLYTHTGRQWLEDEYELSRLHTVSGEVLLAARPSTKHYAPAALGHHAWYDGSERSYPDSYHRLEYPERQMVDIISLTDWLETMVYISHLHTGIRLSFDEAVEKALELEGRRFSPMLTARLQDRETAERLRLALERGRRTALERLYTGETK